MEPEDQNFGLYGVMGPDEFKLMVNNNCYMNLLSKKLFDYTAEVLKEMKKKAPAQLKALSSRLAWGRKRPRIGPARPPK